MTGSPTRTRTPVNAGTDNGMGTMQFQLEMRKLEMEQERCIRDLQLRHELELARIATGPRFIYSMIQTMTFRACHGLNEYE